MLNMKFELLFIYKGQKTSIQGDINLPMKKILEAFKNKLKLNNINLRFEYGHEAIKEDITLGTFVSQHQIVNNKIEITVFEENEDKTEILSEDIICPECKQEARIKNITDDKVTLECSQAHFSEIKKTEFNKSQMIIKESIKCKCQYSLVETKRFCLTCQEILCKFCENDHKKNNNDHLIIDYAQKNFYCLEHNKCKNQFISYCKICKKNLCWLCNPSHRNHQIVEFNEMYYFIDKLILKHKAFSSIYKKLMQEFDEFKKQLDNFRATNEMNENIIKNYNIDNRNYTKLINYKEIYENNFNLQKINKMVKNLTNLNKNNNNYQEININNVSYNIKKEEMIEEQAQENRECNSIISFNNSQILNVSQNLLNNQSFDEKIENNNEVKINIDLKENYKKSIENEEKNDECSNKSCSSKDIILLKEKRNEIENENKDEIANKNQNANQIANEDENQNVNEDEIANKNEKEDENQISYKDEIANENKNEEQEDEDESEIKVNNNTKITQPFHEIYDKNEKSENDKVHFYKKDNEEKIQSCYKNEERVNEYKDNESKQRIFENKKYLINVERTIYIHEETKNQIKIIYNTKNIQGEKVRILGKIFVINNKGKCKLIYNNQEYDLKEYFDIPKDNKGNLEIILVGIDKITDASGMFAGCTLLENIEDISKWDTSNVTNMNKMFENCESLYYMDLSQWNLINVTTIKYMFCNCKSLKDLGDLSGWNTNNITNMSHLFENCESLSSLPDISKWNLKKVTNIDYFFSGCKSLERLPDLSKWNVDCITSMNHLFMNCESLQSLPDLSKWNLINVTSIENMFCGCKSLKALPDISTWKINKVTDISHLFEDCETLSSLPDISKWDVKNVKNMEYMLFNCLGLKKIRFFKKVYKVENISYLYYGCESLEIEPDLKEWNLNEIKKKEYFNGNCFKIKKK